MMYLCKKDINAFTAMKRAIIIGATSGIGQEVARLLVNSGWHIGIAGRRVERLKAFQKEFPDRIEIEAIDVTEEKSEEKFHALIERLGGMDLFLLSSGIGFQNKNLIADIELSTIQTNALGFTRMTTVAFNFFKAQHHGHLAIISSVAGTKGLGIAPAYSATKRFQNIYIDALEQLAHLEKLNIQFTDIRPGFVATDLLNDGKQYPLLMDKKSVAKKVLKAIDQKRRVIVIDYRYQLIVFFWRMLPQFIWKRMPIKTRG